MKEKKKKKGWPNDPPNFQGQKTFTFFKPKKMLNVESLNIPLFCSLQEIQIQIIITDTIIIITKISHYNCPEL